MICSPASCQLWLGQLENNIIHFGHYTYFLLGNAGLLSIIRILNRSSSAFIQINYVYAASSTTDYGHLNTLTGCSSASFSSTCSLCSFTPPLGFTKKMMEKEGWRLPLHPLLTLIQCQSGARGERMSSHFGGEGVCGEPQLCGPYLPPSLLVINQPSMVCRFLLLSYQLP